MAFYRHETTTMISSICDSSLSLLMQGVARAPRRALAGQMSVRVPAPFVSQSHQPNQITRWDPGKCVAQNPTRRFARLASHRFRGLKKSVRRFLSSDHFSSPRHRNSCWIWQLPLQRVYLTIPQPPI